MVSIDTGEETIHTPPIFISIIPIIHYFFILSLNLPLYNSTSLTTFYHYLFSHSLNLLLNPFPYILLSSPLLYYPLISQISMYTSLDVTASLVEEEEEGEGLVMTILPIPMKILPITISPWSSLFICSCIWLMTIILGCGISLYWLGFSLPLFPTISYRYLSIYIWSL